MDINLFLKGVLESQELLPEQEVSLQAHKKEVTDFLCAEFGNKPVIKYAGSHEKGTMIRDNYDLDIVCYFPSTDPRSLADIRKDVSDHLSKKYVIQPKASAERITNLKGASTPQSYHIDVVPGRFIENSKDVFIHVAHGDKERMQTKLKTHIDYIANSGCVPVIRLVKVWSCRNDIKVKTFILELFVIKALAGTRDKDNLKESFIKVMEAFANTFGSTQLEDPANPTGNVVSRSISSTDKMMVSQAAEGVHSKLKSSNSILDWKAVFKEGDNGDSLYTPSQIAPTPLASRPQPWA